MRLRQWRTSVDSNKDTSTYLVMICNDSFELKYFICSSYLIYLICTFIMTRLFIIGQTRVERSILLHGDAFPQSAAYLLFTASPPLVARDLWSVISVHIYTNNNHKKWNADFPFTLMTRCRRSVRRPHQHLCTSIRLNGAPSEGQSASHG